LADGKIQIFGGEPINLDPSAVVYYVRMMTPAVFGKDQFGKDKIRVPAEISPEKSLMVMLGFDDFGVDDYMLHFGDRDRAQLDAARRIEADRALREQQDREHADAVEQQIQRNAKKTMQQNAATTIQRVSRGHAGRKKVAQMRSDAAAAAAKPQTPEELRAARLKAFG
jgi:hypothetical protein